MNHALDHHFHGNPEKRFTQRGITDELKLRSRRHEPRMADKHWKQKKTTKTKGPKNAA